MSSQTVVKQHVVSQVVLSEFAVDRQLEAEDVRQPGRWRPKSPAAVGYVNDFVPHDSATIEALWHSVETRLPQAMEVVRGGTAPRPGSPEESILRDCVALHWARSKATKTAANRAWLKVQAEHEKEFRVRGRRVLAALHERRTGRPGSRKELDALNAELNAGPEEVLDGRHFASAVPQWYEFARKRFATNRVQVLVCDDRVDDLVMSDTPVLTPTRRGPGLNPAQGVALGDATGAGMPLGPRVFVSLHDAAEVVVLDAAQVRQLNAFQASVRDLQMFRRRPQGRPKKRPRPSSPGQKM